MQNTQKAVQTKQAMEVVYAKNGTNYRAIVPVRFIETAEQQIIMTRKVGRSDIKSISPVQVRA